MLRRTTLALCLAALPAFAQEDDRSYLTAFLEDNLSGAGRQVVVTGFEGALSSQARIAELTIADDLGVWLTLRDVVMDWNRAALLRGNVSVNQLTAAEIIVMRMPVSDTESPAPEAGSFTLPDLPVSVAIGRVAADRITLSADVLGQPVVGLFEASVNLVDGEGDIDLVLERRDEGPEGRIALKAAYSNASRRLSLDLSAHEGANGLVAQALDLPGRPSATLSVIGKGPFSDFIADVALATDGAERLAGRFVTQSGAGDTGFAANLSGDLAPLFLPDYAAFFGNKVALVAQGTAHDDGRLDLSRVKLVAEALDLTGNLSLGADGSPRRFALTGRIAHADGAPVLLPLASDQPLRVQIADLDVGYDVAKGQGWTARATALGVERDDLGISRLALTGSGRIAPGQFGATVTFDAEGLQPTSRALSDALGSVVSGDAVFFLRKGAPDLAIPRLTLTGQDYKASVTGLRISGLDQGLKISGKVLADLTDLSRFSALTEMPLSGAARAEVSGEITPLGGGFDLTLKADGQDMQLGQPMLDGLLRGQAMASAKVRRDETGTRVSDGVIRGNGVEGTVEGLVSSTTSDLAAKLRLSDLSVIGPGFGGTAEAEARLTGPFDHAKLTATGATHRLRIGNPEIDKVLGGDSRIVVDLDLQDRKLRINRASLSNDELTADITGLADGTQQVLDVTAQLRNLGLLLPEFPGALKVSGKVVNDGAGAQINFSGSGPGGIDATVTGRIATGFNSADLVIRGQAQAALANAFILPRSISGAVGFDLRMNGPFALSSLRGPVTLKNGRFADPSLPFGLDGISGRADLSNGQATVAATLPLTTRGTVAVAGTIGLDPPHQSALGLALKGVVLRDPDLYETQLRGALKLTGPLLAQPLLSGRIDLVETELRVPSTGFGGAAGLPDLRHVNEPAAVRTTRARAGLLAKSGDAARAGAGDLALNILISAPNRLFIRGRGLDAELGGEVRLLGNLSSLQPAGAFNLIRGRLDLLGKRFDLTEALLQLEGDLVPFLRIVASTENDGVTANVLIEGRADDPQVSFTSIPDLPEEEVLAQLLFGQGLQNLSAFQALQLASAVATLAGRGGEGIVAKLRQGFGLDNLDLKTSAEGEAEVSFGKYIGKKIYTEITVGQDGKSQIDLNLDLTKSITLRGSAGSDGQTGLGVFLEKDY